MVRAIKYYDLEQNEERINGTCYDGTKEFTKLLSERLYPDEYLIADILEKYIQQTVPSSEKQFFVVKEKWKGNGGTRDGGKNVAIGDEIIKIIDTAPSANTLILAPFLFHYHHPGIAVDLKNKVAIYLDPYGSEPYNIADLQMLQSKLLERGYTFLVVKAEQQQRGKDFSSCGPILTASMIKFINEFLENNSITTEFKTPRKHLATDRIVQLNVRNPNDLKQIADATVNEIGLADVNLWIIFLNEQGYTDKKNISSILCAITEQKRYIGKLPLNWERDDLSRSNVEFILDFQLNLSNLLLTKNTSLMNSSSIAELLEKSQEIFAVSDQTKELEDLTVNTNSSLSMMVLSGFITTLGIAAVAIAFTVLNAATGGIPGLVAAGVGIAIALSGVGLFATCFDKGKPEINEELTHNRDEPANLALILP